MKERKETILVILLLCVTIAAPSQANIEVEGAKVHYGTADEVVLWAYSPTVSFKWTGGDARFILWPLRLPTSRSDYGLSPHDHAGGEGSPGAIYPHQRELTSPVGTAKDEIKPEPHEEINARSRLIHPAT